MKKLAITAVATLSLVTGAMAQSTVAIDNNLASGYFTANGGGAANAYSGTYGLEVWALGGTTVPANLTGITPKTGYAQPLYANFATDGLTLIQTYVNQTLAGGIITAANLPGGGIVTVPSTVSPTAGSPLVLGLAIWNNNAATFTAGAGIANALLGVNVFVNGSGAPNNSPPAPPLDLSGTGASVPGMASDTVMMPTVPEPGIFALGGLGAAALLIFRRRK